MTLSTLDITIITLYLAVVLGIGAWFARKQGGARDYFLGRHTIPWWAVMLSIVATETSALTVISVPGIGARGNLTFLQLPLGYLAGRTAVAIWLIPGYFRGEQETAYTRLERRFGTTTRRTASIVFMIIRSLGDSVRVFATAIPVALITGWSIEISIVVVAAATLVYTWAGGIRAVVWVDVMQLFIYVAGGLIAIAVAVNLAGGLDEVLAAAGREGKLQMLDFRTSFSIPYTFLGGVIGGALLSTASHGTDHLIVQRLLATRNVRAARKALVGSGIVVLIQFGIFLLVGTFIWAAGHAPAGTPDDELFPRFIIEFLPAGLSGVVVAGILAAAMSTVSSSLNSLAAATTYDFYGPLTGRNSEAELIRFGRWATVGWAIVLSAGALMFKENAQPVVVLALSIASITYGGLLGLYVMAGWSERFSEPDALLGVLTAGVAMTVIVFVKPWPFGSLAWPWYVPLGLGISLAAGLASLAFRTMRRA